MSKRGARQPVSLGDRLALEVQELHRKGKVPDTQPLLRIDQRKEAAEAPYQFDAVRGRLHKTGCRAIPPGSRSALYGVWEFRSGEKHLACPRCKPMTTRGKKTTSAADAPASDLLYGLLSILDQFGGVLRERGREFRRSRSGEQVRSGVEGLYKSLGSGERDVLNVIATALDGLGTMVTDLQRSLDAPNGSNGTARRTEERHERAHAHRTNGHGAVKHSSGRQITQRVTSG
jgi:hypothetical protein